MLLPESFKKFSLPKLLNAVVVIIFYYNSADHGFIVSLPNETLLGGFKMISYVSFILGHF